MAGVPDPEDVIESVEMADGRQIVMTASALDHIAFEHPEMASYGWAILETARTQRLRSMILDPADAGTTGAKRALAAGCG